MAVKNAAKKHMQAERESICAEKVNILAFARQDCPGCSGGGT